MGDLRAAGGTAGAARDPQLEAWIGRHPGYVYDVTGDGHHLVKTRDGQVVAHDLNPAAALEIARSWE